MSLVFSDEQEELRHTVRSFLEHTSPESEVRRLMETAEGYDPAVWRQMAEQLGLQGLHVPEEYGGAGFGYVELGIVLEEMGARLLCAPFLASAVLATGALLAVDDPAARAELLPGLVDGTAIGTLAFAGPSGRPDTGAPVALAPVPVPAPVPAPISTPADRLITAASSGAAGAYTLRGTRHFVLDGAVAGLILVTAWADGGLSLFAVSGDAPGLTRSPLPVMDLTRKQADLTFTDTPARLIGAEGAAGPVLTQVVLLACVALANEGAGGARAVLDQAVHHARERLQFGRPIGSSQAVRHQCADMLVAVEGSKSAAYHAARVADSGKAERLAQAASLAKAYVGEAYFSAAAENIKIHGSIGFTWEHPAHLYFRRAETSELMFGGPAHHRGLLAGQLTI
ncbi:acyl-CoA dehydrogenase [Parafrankia colletiae]|uniref:Acyl-CoA dehydrogenase n=1 Tax=Parafrankia colletiae TaxID=573497 RepID=A0A1S1QIC2_9ACTN|nr:acyl-CoA dehydrogenase family protein [Parafrankia colletiae]MCK9900437.1 acyl-CoA/acyl-ACP dehydrogenase [Frankia sp. Cpl3]OHV33730.1 acyl-CoA dehydrogenase [Parafrankia colletiae]